MEKLIQRVQVTDEAVMSKIYFIRGQKVMIDRDLAELYDVETKQLKRQVKRNIERFPEDFMFELNEEEFENWRSHFGTSNSSEKMGLRYAPYAFSEQGLTMLSCVLSSARAIAVNIQIIRIFTRMREMILTHKDILLKLEELEQRVSKHDENIEMIFQVLKELLVKPNPPREKIGFKCYDEK